MSNLLPCILRFMRSNNGQKIVPFQELTSSLVAIAPWKWSPSWKEKTEETYVKKKEQPRTWLCRKLSCVFSWPNSSTGSDQRMSHIKPCVGGSRNRSIYHLISVNAGADGKESLRFVDHRSSGTPARVPRGYKGTACSLLQPMVACRTNPCMHCKWLQSIYVCIRVWTWSNRSDAGIRDFRVRETMCPGTRFSATTNTGRTNVPSSVQPLCDEVEQWTDLNTEVPSVDIISEKQISRVSGVASNFEELHQVILITVEDMSVLTES